MADRLLKEKLAAKDSQIVGGGSVASFPVIAKLDFRITSGGW